MNLKMGLFILGGYLLVVGASEVYSDNSTSDTTPVDTLATLPSPGSYFPGSGGYWDLIMGGAAVGAAYFYL